MPDVKVSNSDPRDFGQHTYNLSLSLNGVTFSRTVSEQAAWCLAEITVEMTEDLLAHVDYLRVIGAIR